MYLRVYFIIFLFIINIQILYIQNVNKLHCQKKY